MSRRSCFQTIVVVSILAFIGSAHGGTATISDSSKECISCHASATPAIVADWKKSRHALVTPSDALKKPEKQRRVSAEKIPDNLTSVAVGCAECHMMNPDAHKDSFEHNDQKVHLTVTPKDCSTCHATEAAQFEKKTDVSCARESRK